MRSMKVENYVSKKEKASSINQWWQNTPNPTYKKYKMQVDDSDIVEYNKVRQLKRGGNLSTSAIEQVIS